MKKLIRSIGLIMAIAGCLNSSAQASLVEAGLIPIAVGAGAFVGTKVGHYAGGWAAEGLLKYYFLFLDGNWRKTLLPGLKGSFIKWASFKDCTYAYQALLENSESFWSNIAAGGGKAEILKNLQREVNRLKPIGNALGLLTGGIAGAAAGYWFIKTAMRQNEPKNYKRYTWQDLANNALPPVIADTMESAKKQPKAV